MNVRAILPLLTAALFPITALASEENQLARTQLLATIEREHVPTSVSAEIPLAYYGPLSIEEFAKRPSSETSKTFLKFLNAVQSGKGEVAKLVEQTNGFEITNEAAFRDATRKKLFPEGGELKIVAEAETTYGIAYFVEIWKGDQRLQTVIFPVLHKEETDAPLVQIKKDSALLELLEQSINIPLGGHEVGPNKTELTMVHYDPWTNVRPRTMILNDAPEFKARVQEVISKLEANRLDEAVMPGSQRFLASSLDRASAKERKRIIGELVAPIQNATMAFDFSPVYVLVGTDYDVDPVILFDSEESGLRLANVRRKDAFLRFVDNLRAYPVRAPRPEPEEETETAPH